MNHNQKNSIIANNSVDLPKVDGSCQDIGKCSRRALVFSSGDAERMAVASSRARLMMDLVKNPDDSREFGSYYRGRRCHNNPANCMTSHTATIPIPTRIVPTYPSLVQSVRWDSSVEKYSEDSQTEMKEEKRFHCRCNNCKMEHCPGRERPEVDTGPVFTDDNNIIQENSRGFVFRDNIMRFTDNSTMTSNLTDAYCEVLPTYQNLPPETTEVYISTSENDNRQRIQKQTSSTYPTPILKKPVCDTCCYQTYGNRNMSRMSVVGNEAVKDTGTCNDYEKLINSIPRRQFTEKYSRPPIRDSFVDIESCRKNLYNEGISDSIAETNIPQFLGCPPRMPAPIQCPVRKDFSRFHSPHRPSTKKDYTRGYNKVVCEREPAIPFAHRERSRYHYDCKGPVNKVNVHYDDDCGRHGLVVSSRIPKPTHASRVLLCDRSSSKMPKKLLSSERDIDSFISSKRMNLRF